MESVIVCDSAGASDNAWTTRSDWCTVEYAKQACNMVKQKRNSPISLLAQKLFG
jgi:hypothetical protein